MRDADKACAFLLVLAVCLVVGCSGDDGAGPDDDNPPSTEMTHAWSKRFGDGQIQNPWGVAVDTHGNAIVVGEVTGSIDFGGGPMTSAGRSDAFVAKFVP